MKPMKLLLPGIFLLVLGIGNISVGTFKGAQYQQVLNELSVMERTQDNIQPSPLARFQLSGESAVRADQRLRKARARRDFYELVTFGGKGFVCFSLVLLVLAGLFHYSELTRRSRSGAVQLPAL